MKSPGFPFRYTLMFIGSEKRFLTSMAPVELLSNLTARRPPTLEKILPKQKEASWGDSPETLHRTISNNSLPPASPIDNRPTSMNPSDEKEKLKKRHPKFYDCVNGRPRRVYGPVKGNNTCGKRGKLMCTQCRKIRSKGPPIALPSTILLTVVHLYIN